jgi:hypothetical protein
MLYSLIGARSEQEPHQNNVAQQQWNFEKDDQ